MEAANAKVNAAKNAQKAAGQRAAAAKQAVNKAAQEQKQAFAAEKQSKAKLANAGKAFAALQSKCKANPAPKCAKKLEQAQKTLEAAKEEAKSAAQTVHLAAMKTQLAKQAESDASAALNQANEAVAHHQKVLEEKKDRLKAAQASAHKANAVMDKMKDKLERYEREERVSKERLVKAGLGERERKDKQAKEVASKKAESEQKQKAGANTREEEIKYKSAMERRTKESTMKKEKSDKVKERADKVVEKETKEKATEKQQKQKEIANKQAIARLNQLRDRYSAEAADKTKWPPVCLSTEANKEYMPQASPPDPYLFKILNDLLEAQKKNGGGMIQNRWTQKNDDSSTPKTADQKMAEFQKDNNIDDAPGCVGANTWRALLCPMPLTTAMCHTELACVLALQTLLFRWVPAGRKTGRYCKQTMNQMRVFQRLYNLDPHGNTYEQDFITLARRNEARTDGHGEVPPAWAKKPQ